ncbi:translation termination factor eRF1, partial [Coemansia sp. BCRC 34490]
FKNDLAKSDLFDPRLAAKVIKTVDVSYGGENGFDQAINLSQEALSNVKFVQEQRLINKYFEEIAQDTGKIVYGVTDTLRALDAGAVETLIVWENLDVKRYVFTDAEGSEIERYLTPEQEADRSNFLDNTTGADLNLVSEGPLLEWLAEIYKQKGAALEFITDRSQEGSQFVKGFGGMGGLLRWQLDVSQLAGADNEDLYYDSDGSDEESDDDKYYF